jgi:transcriptional regulator with XRE-family HTH domain
MKIGEVLKKLRLLYSVSAKDLAHDIGISPSYLSEIENSKKKTPSLELLNKYSQVFEIKVSTIMLMAEDYSENRRKKSKPEMFIQKRLIKILNKHTDELEEK